MRLLGYARVSTLEQQENTSLADQKRKLSAYCDAFSHVLVDVLQEVGSGTSMETRPKFQRALGLLTSGAADGIIVTKLDRLARNTVDVLTLVDEVLVPKNKALVMMDLNVDTSSPIGRMILTVMSAVAQLERDTIKERLSSGRRAKAEAGGYAYGTPAYGTAAVDAQLVEVSHEQEVISTIISLRNAGLSLRAIAARLNDERIPTKQGREWQAQSVKNVIDRIRTA